MLSSADTPERIREMYLSDYLAEIGTPEIGGNGFYFNNHEVNSFVRDIERWSLANIEYLPDLFLRQSEETASLNMRVQLPNIDYSSCPREFTHFGERIDEYGRTVCSHCNHYVVPTEQILGKTEEYDKLSAKKRVVYKIDESPSEFSLSTEVYKSLISKASMAEKSMISERCDAIISDLGARLPLEYIVRKVNTSGNKIKATFRSTENGVSDYITLEYGAGKEIPPSIAGHNLSGKQEILSFPYGPKHIAKLVKLWYMQEPEGSAPAYSQGTPYGST